MLLKKALWILTAVTVFAGAAHAQYGYRTAPTGPTIEFEARLWMPDLSGGIQVSEGGFGTIIDLDEDLGISEDDSIEGRFTWYATRRSRLRFAYQTISATGDSVVSRTINFSGVDFNVSTRLLSNFDIEYARVGWAWQLFASRNNRFRIGPLLEVKAFRGDAGIAAPDLVGLVGATEKFEAAFGSAGLILDVEFMPKLHGYAESTVLVESDEDGDLSDTEFGLRYLVTKNITVVAGVRTFEVDVTQNDDRLDFDLDGTFFGVGFRY